MIEPFRIRSVEPLRITTCEEQERALVMAHDTGQDIQALLPCLLPEPTDNGRLPRLHPGVSPCASPCRY